MPTPRRAAFIMVNIARMPLWGWPTSQPFASSKFITQVAEALMPILCSIDAAARRRCAAPGVPSALGRNLGTRNRLMPLVPGGRVGQPRQHQVHDVLGQVVLAGRDEDLGAGDACSCRRSAGHRLGAQHAEVGAAMRLGQAHGARPGAVDQLRQVGSLQLLACREAYSAL